MKKSILLVYPYPNQKKLVQSYISNIRKCGHKIEYVCIGNLDVSGVEKFRISPVMEKHFSNAKRFVDQVENLSKILRFKGGRKLSVKLRIYAYRKMAETILPLLSQFDFVDFHAFEKTYDTLIRYCRNNYIPYDITFWGSDLMRASEKRIQDMVGGIEGARYLKMADSLKDVFVKKYGDVYDSKLKVVRLGNTNLDKIMEQDDVKTSIIKKNIYGEIEDKLIIILGYNASPYQNHSIMLDAIEKLDDDKKNNLLVVLPMTYLGTSEYISFIRNRALKTGTPFILLDSFLSEEELIMLRKTADIVINIQDTDANSASLQDHLFCEELLLIGDWLNYIPYFQENVYYIRVNRENLKDKLSDAITNYKSLRDNCCGNREKIYRIGGWDNVIKAWSCLYDELYT